MITAAGGQANWFDPQYDAGGNMIWMPRPSNPTLPNQLSYDAWNRAVTVKQTVTIVQKNEYDGLHRRIVKEKYVGGTLNETRHYYYNENWQVLEERVVTCYPKTSPSVRRIWR